jgi:NADH-quinone oxidoreductase subunit G
VAGVPAGSGGVPTYRDLEAAGAVVVVDLDPHEESPILFLRLRKAALRRDVKVVAVGPRPGRLAEFATVVATEPGGEAEALERLARGEGDAGRLLRDAAGLPAAPGAAGEATGAPAAGPGAGAEAGGPAPGVIVLAGWRGGASGGLAAAARLADGLGAAFAWVPRRAGDRGALDAGARPDLLPGGRPVADAGARAELAEAWGAEPPEAPGLDAAAMVRAAAEGELGVLVLAGVDLVHDHGPRELAEQALERAFVIAVDHEVNDTTRHADVLLPAVVHAETEGTFTDWEGRVQATHPAVPIGGAAQAVWELADQLSVRLGTDLGLATLARVTAETERFRSRPTGGAESAPTDRGTPRFSGAPLRGSPDPSGGSPGPPRPDPPGRASSEPVELAGPSDGLALVTYPLLLDAASMLARADDLNRETPGAFLELHPDDAGRLGLADGATAEVDFGEDRTARLPVRVAPTVAPGCAFIPANQPDLGLRALLGPAPALRVTVTAVEEAAA